MPVKKQLHSMVEIVVKQLIQDLLSSGACKELVTFVNYKAAHTGPNIAFLPQHPAIMGIDVRDITTPVI